jgi:hypothetical protein
MKIGYKIDNKIGLEVVHSITILNFVEYTIYNKTWERISIPTVFIYELPRSIIKSFYK